MEASEPGLLYPAGGTGLAPLLLAGLHFLHREMRVPPCLQVFPGAARPGAQQRVRHTWVSASPPHPMGHFVVVTGASLFQPIFSDSETGKRSQH